MALANAFISGVQQVALVVRDIDKALEEYTHRLGIGPWWVSLYGPPKMTNMRLRGKEVSYSMKLAIAWTGDTMWELIEPVDGPSIYKEFLDAHGEGLHYLLVRHDDVDFDTALATFTQRGCPPLMEGTIGEVQFAYVETEGPLKTVLEIVRRPRGYVRPVPDYWYPGPPEDA
jgi:catechol 2,3-dioxygenase-like lactoylglutathione lyase family enzyme